MIFLLQKRTKKHLQGLLSFVLNFDSTTIIKLIEINLIKAETLLENYGIALVVWRE